MSDIDRRTPRKLGKQNENSDFQFQQLKQLWNWKLHFPRVLFVTSLITFYATPCFIYTRAPYCQPFSCFRIQIGVREPQCLFPTSCASFWFNHSSSGDAIVTIVHTWFLIWCYLLSSIVCNRESFCNFADYLLKKSSKLLANRTWYYTTMHPILLRLGSCLPYFFPWLVIIMAGEVLWYFNVSLLH